MSRKLPVIEIFGPTIQGEGADVGRPCYFVRFGGCDYKCSWCDSMHAVDPAQVRANKTDMTPHTIVSEIVALPGNASWVILSGGNPALFDLTFLIAALYEEGFKVSVETQGSRWQSWLTKCDIVCLSPKGPSAKMQHKFNPEMLTKCVNNLQAAGTDFFVKVPLFNDNDITFLESLVLQYPGVEFFASIGNEWAPGSEMSREAKRTPRNLAEFRNDILEHTTSITEKLLANTTLGSVRMVPQVHTLLWGNELGR